MNLRKPAVLATLTAICLCTVPLAADVTINITTSIEGGLAGGPSGAGMTPKIVTRISGEKSRTDVDTGDQAVSTIIDTAANQAFVLRPNEKTAMQIPIDTAAQGPQTASGPPAIVAEVKPTGQSRDIDGIACAEYSVSMRMDMAAVVASGGSSLPPEATTMLKDVFLKISGSTWVAKDAPGTADYLSFQKAAAQVAIAAMSRLPGTSGSPSPVPRGMERLVTGFPEAPGIPYLTELTTAVEGTGQFVGLLQGMAQMKITSKVTGVSTEAISAETFAVPEGFTVVKQ
jgi:hypothetical protein